MRFSKLLSDKVEGSATLLALLLGCISCSAQTSLENQDVLPASAPAAGEATLHNSMSSSGDTVGYLELHRRQAITKLLRDPRGPLDSTSIFGLRYFPLDDSLRFSAIFRASDDTTLINFPTSDGQIRAYRIYGKLLFQWDQQWRELTVFELPGMAQHPVYGDHLFLPFMDETNGDSSYGGGRYIDLSRSRLDAGDYTLDFNLAYNPWCAYASGYSCPVPPPSNRLGFAVVAGEAAYVAPKDVSP